MPVGCLEFRWGALYLAAGIAVALVLGTMPAHPLPLEMLFPVVAAIALSRTYGPVYVLLRDRSPNKSAARACATVMNAMTVTPVFAAVLLDSPYAVGAIGVVAVGCGTAYLERIRRNIEDVAGRQFVDLR